MPTNVDIAQLKAGQFQFGTATARDGSYRGTVQVVPIRSRHTGTIVRFSVRLTNGGRGTVAR